MIKMIVAFLLIAGILYLAGAFVYTSLNAFTWPVYARFIYAVAVLAVLFVATDVFFEELEALKKNETV